MFSVCSSCFYDSFPKLLLLRQDRFISSFILRCLPFLPSMFPSVVPSGAQFCAFCHPKSEAFPNAHLFTQAGITMGNVYLLLPFCALFFVGLFELYKRCRGGRACTRDSTSSTRSASLLLDRDMEIDDSTSRVKPEPCGVPVLKVAETLP